MRQILVDFGCFVPCHKCIDNQINTFAGIELRLECNEIMKTKNYNLETGAGLSTSAGIEYFGKRFEDNFAEFIEKYHFTDIYSSGFYDFETEEKWAYWAKHMYINCIGNKSIIIEDDIKTVIEKICNNK